MKVKVLVIQQKKIGDVLVSSLLCRHLKENIPNAEIHFVANTGTEAVLINNPYIDSIIYFAPEYRKSYRSFLSFLTGLRTKRYHVVIDVYGKIESLLMTLFSGADKKIAHRKGYTRFFYTHPIKSIKGQILGEGLAIENRLRLLNPLIDSLKSPEALPEIYLSEDEVQSASKALLDQGIRPGQPLLMISLLGSVPSKTYPLDYMAQLLEEVVHASPQTTLLLNYIPRQKPEVDKLFGLLSSKTSEMIRPEVYTSNLRGFLALLHHCKALVGNEGGAVNMAKAIGIPTYSIYSPRIEKEAWDTHRQAGFHLAVHLKDFEPEHFVGMDKKALRKASSELYRQFKPKYFKDSLRVFIQKHFQPA